MQAIDRYLLQRNFRTPLGSDARILREIENSAALQTAGLETSLRAFYRLRQARWSPLHPDSEHHSPANIEVEMKLPDTIVESLGMGISVYVHRSVLLEHTPLVDKDDEVQEVFEVNIDTKRPKTINSITEIHVHMALAIMYLVPGFVSAAPTSVLEGVVDTLARKGLSWCLGIFTVFLMFGCGMQRGSSAVQIMRKVSLHPSCLSPRYFALYDFFPCSERNFTRLEEACIQGTSRLTLENKDVEEFISNKQLKSSSGLARQKSGVPSDLRAQYKAEGEQELSSMSFIGEPERLWKILKQRNTQLERLFEDPFRMHRILFRKYTKGDARLLGDQEEEANN